jgi:hypothetical protein
MLSDSTFEYVTRSEELIEDDVLEIRTIVSLPIDHGFRQVSELG